MVARQSELVQQATARNPRVALSCLCSLGVKVTEVASVDSLGYELVEHSGDIPALKP